MTAFAFIVAAEIAFWALLLGGLASRYILGRRRLGLALLIATPFVDVALLVATTIDLRGGGEAALPHALAAVYIGVTVAGGTGSSPGPTPASPTGSRAGRSPSDRPARAPHTRPGSGSSGCAT